MDFKTAMEHYKAGTASDEERALVESELEKNRLIAEYLDAEWDAPAAAEDVAAAEDLKKVRTLLKRHDWKTILKGIALITALALVCAWGLIPLAESFFWSPEQFSYGQMESDLALALQAYTELFHPGMQISGVLFGDTGFASHDLRISLKDCARNEYDYISGTLKTGTLSLDWDFYAIDPTDVLPFRSLEPFEMEETLDTLNMLPEYVVVQAAVTFPEDMDMAELTQFWLDYTWSAAEYPLDLNWAAIRNCGPDDNWPICGINLRNSGLDIGVNEYYPQFHISSANPDGSPLEQHFKSILQFSSDQWEKGRILGGWGTAGNYYDAVLEYVEENGIYSYGCIVSGSPKALLNLQEDGIVTQIRILDGWLGVE